MTNMMLEILKVISSNALVKKVVVIANYNFVLKWWGIKSSLEIVFFNVLLV